MRASSDNEGRDHLYCFTIRHPVVPTALRADRCWSFSGSWTNMLIPKPFSKVLLITGTPIRLPDNLPRENMAAWAALLQSEMERLDEIAKRRHVDANHRKRDE